MAWRTNRNIVRQPQGRLRVGARRREGRRLGCSTRAVWTLAIPVQVVRLLAPDLTGTYGLTTTSDGSSKMHHASP